MEDKEIFLNSGGAQRGPFSIAEVQRQIASGECTPTTLAWKGGMDDWQPVSSLTELSVIAEEGAEPSVAVEDGAPPAVPASPPITYPSGGAGHPQGAQTNGLAIASLVLGCLSLASGLMVACFAIVLAIPAVIMGHCALSQIRSQPDRYVGQGLAKGGLWTGYICIVLSILLALLILGVIALAPGILNGIGD